MQHPKRILVVDDEAPMRYLAAHYLEAAGYLVAEACDGYQAQMLATLAVENDVPFDLMVLDINLFHLPGNGLINEFVTQPICPPVILLTVNGDIKHLAFAHDPRCLAAVHKPFTAEVLREAVSHAFRILSGHECRSALLSMKTETTHKEEDE